MLFFKKKYKFWKKSEFGENACFLITPIIAILKKTMEIHDRLKQVREYFKLSIREFSKEIYFSHSLYGQTELGAREPNDRIIQLISSRFNVNKDWILTGNGKMFDSNPPDVRLEKILEIYTTIDQPLKDCLLEQSNILLKIHREYKK